MRSLSLIVALRLLALPALTTQVLAEETKAAASQTCSANSADRTQSCSVTCPEGKTPTCVGGAQGAKDVDCTCK